jgi:hypothetical protein
LPVKAWRLAIGIRLRCLQESFKKISRYALTGQGQGPLSGQVGGTFRGGGWNRSPGSTGPGPASQGLAPQPLGQLLNQSARLGLNR